jgi:nucleoside-diphosphate-sugar epimerase
VKNILITGGCGFLGARLAARLLAEFPECRIVLADIMKHPRVEKLLQDGRCIFKEAWINRPEVCTELLADRPEMVVHLASLVSGGAEKDFPAGMQANVYATQHLLEACRVAGHAPRVIFASSIATYGGPELPDRIDDFTFQHPQNSYGVAKVIGELLLHDYTRKGYIDGRGIRLAAIVIRDEPNTAVSGYASSIARAPLAGERYVCPVSRETRVPVMSIKACVDSLMALCTVDAARFQGGWRTVNGPNISPTAGEMAAVVERFMAERGGKADIMFQPDEAIQRMISAWPKSMDASRAAQLGLPGDSDYEQIVRDYAETLVSGAR